MTNEEEATNTMVPTTTTEGNDAANGTPGTTAATIPPASNNTPHGKNPNGSTLITPGARPRIDTPCYGVRLQD